MLQISTEYKPPPSPQLAPVTQAAELSRSANDTLARAIRKNPTRFGGFGCLPWQDPKAAVIETSRIGNELGLKGVMIIGRPGADFLDHGRYFPILAKLSELGLPLYVHPGFPLPQVRDVYYGGLNRQASAGLSVFGWGWHNEAGVHVIRMMLSGIFDKLPNLRVISGHWGEMVPFYLQRLDDTLPKVITGLSKTITETYKEHVFVTPSGMLTVPHFDFIHKTLGADRIIYSIDYPYLTQEGARQFLEGLPISDRERAQIAHLNAEKLLKL